MARRRGVVAGDRSGDRLVKVKGNLMDEAKAAKAAYVAALEERERGRRALDELVRVAHQSMIHAHAVLAPEEERRNHLLSQIDRAISKRENDARVEVLRLRRRQVELRDQRRGAESMVDRASNPESEQEAERAMVRVEVATEESRREIAKAEAEHLSAQEAYDAAAKEALG